MSLGDASGVVAEIELQGAGIPSDGELAILRFLARLGAGVVAGDGQRAGLSRGRPLGLVVLDADGVVRGASSAIVTLIGLDPRHSVGIQAFDLVHPDDLEAAARGLDRSAEYPGEKFPLDVRLRVADGSWASLELVALTSEDECIDGVILEVRATSDRSGLDRLVAHQSRVLAMIGRGAPLSESLTELAGLVEQFSGGACCISVLDEERSVLRPLGVVGLSDELVAVLHEVPVEPVSTTCGVAVHRAQATRTPDVTADLGWAGRGEQAATDGFVGCYSAPIFEGASAIGAISVYRGDAEPPTSDTVRLVDACTSIAALAVERARAEALLSYEATHDSLTGLANRARFLQALGDAFAEDGDGDGQVSVLFLDLDRFKVVNDALGHGVGDELLVAVAERLRECVEPPCVVARFGGDEFTVMWRGGSGAEEIGDLGLADRIVDAFRVPIPVGDQELVMTLSIGVARRSSPETTPEMLLRDADAAMYVAKEGGRNRTQVFNQAIVSQVKARLAIAQDLGEALDRAEISLHYQPEVDIASHRVVGVEALMRWHHADWGMVPPSDYIPVAEETGLIVGLGEWALADAISQLARWCVDLADGDTFTAWVNVSAVQLMQPRFASQVAAMLDRSGIPPRRLGLEITESAIMADADLAARTIRSLSALGVQVAIDDFGTGYSSLAYLRQLQVDVVKIDQTFVRDLDAPDDAALVGAIIHMAHAVGCRTVAEGVETAAQFRMLEAMGCDVAQGFGLSRPAPAGQHPPSTLDLQPLWAPSREQSR